MSTSIKLQGKVAFVTGGSRGIGAAVVRRLAADGATVAFTYQHSADAAEALIRSIQESGGRALAFRADAADAAAVTDAIDTVARELGTVDILVNNAGVARMADIAEFSLQDFDLTVAVNVRAVFVAIQAAVRHMKAGGRVINIGSTNADRVPVAGAGVYAMSKSALKGLVQGLSRDLGPRGITINNVQPGPVDTDMNPDHTDFAKILYGMMALPRYAKGDEIAGMVSYLASEEAGFVTGANLNIDGGFAA